MIDQRRIAIVILYYRAGAATLERVLHECIRNSTSVVCGIVVDNASMDGVLRTLVLPPNVRVLELIHNVGYAGGMNCGFAEVKSEAEEVLFMTHETLLDEGAIDSMSKTLRDGASVTGPTLRLENGTIWARGSQIDRFGRPVHSTGSTKSSEWLDGAALMVRSKVFERLGGFDDSFFLYWEDVDFGLRASKLGPVVCTSEAGAVQSTGGTPPYLMARGRIRTWRKHGRCKLLLLSVATVLIAGIRDVARYRDLDSLRRLELCLIGIVHGFTGQWRSRHVTWRPKKREDRNG